MRSIEKQMLEAIRTKARFRSANTEVIQANGNTYVKLYDTIIYASVDGRAYYSDGGFKTVTASSRLRALGAAYSTNPKNCSVELTPQEHMRDMLKTDMAKDANCTIKNIGDNTKDERYDYNFNVKSDVRDYARNHHFTILGDRERDQEELYDQCFTSDDVTGNASGSYFCNAWRAGECLLGNWGLLQDACDAYGQDLGEAVRRGEEFCDVTIRCYVLGEAVATVIDELYDNE